MNNKNIRGRNLQRKINDPENQMERKTHSESSKSTLIFGKSIKVLSPGRAETRADMMSMRSQVKTTVNSIAHCGHLASINAAELK